VHPAKREVRFRDPAVIRAVALQAARSAWEKAAPNQKFTPGVGSDPLFPPISKSAWVTTSDSQREFKVQDVESDRLAESPTSCLTPTCNFQLPTPPAVQFIRSLGGRYLLFEDHESLMLIEIRAARERILYERYLARLTIGEMESQRLLLPEVLASSPADVAWIEAHAELLQKAGLSAESFGQGSIKVDAVPADAADLPVMEVVIRLVDELRTQSDLSALDQGIRETLAASVSRLAAAGAKLPAGEESARMLLRDLLSCHLPYATPKGRPTMSQLSPGELARRFSA
jgi:DNA mismatch repair protein MutL